MSIPTNATRTQWGANAIATNPDDNGDETNLADVLANLMHYADREGLNFDECLRMAYLHHADEVNEESN